MQILQFVMQIADPPAARDCFVEDGTAAHLLHILAEISDGQPFRNPDLAVIGLFLAYHHAKERGLARTVWSNQAHFLARVQLKGSIDEHQLLAILLVYVRERNHPKLPS